MTSQSSPDIMEATAAQHVGRPKGEPAQFVRNGKLETCQCRDCRNLARSSAGSDKEATQPRLTLPNGASVSVAAACKAIDFCDWLSGYIGHGPAVQIDSAGMEYIRSKVHPLIAELDARSDGAAQPRQERSDLTKLAAECHRAKWEFDLSEDFQPSKSAARALITNAFNALHRIGDMALKLRDASSVTSTDRGGK